MRESIDAKIPPQIEPTLRATHLEKTTEAKQVTAGARRRAISELPVRANLDGDELGVCRLHLRER